MPRGRWRSLFAFAFAAIVDGSEGGLINGLFPSMRQALGLTLINLSLLTNANKIISAILGPLWAMAGDRYQRKRILVFVTGLWGLWTVAAGFSQNFTQLLALYIIASLGSVASLPIIMSCIADLFPDSQRGRAMGVFGALSVILAALIVPVMIRIATEQAWRYGYYIVGCASVLSGLLIMLGFHDPGRGASDRLTGNQAYTIHKVGLADFGRLLRIPTLAFLFLQKMVNAGQLIWAFGTVYMVDVFGYSNAQAIMMVSIPLFLGSILGHLVSGLLGDRFNRLYPRFGRVALLQAAFFCSAVMSYLATQVHWQLTASFYAVYFIWGIFLNFGTGLDRPMIAAVTPPELRSTAYALWMSTGDALSSVIWISIAGWAGERYGLQVTFLWCMTAVMLVRSLLWFAAYKPYPRDVANMQKVFNHPA